MNTIGLVWLLSLFLVQPAPPPSPEGLPPEVELEELRIIVRTLAEENRALKEALAQLQAASEGSTPPAPTPPSSPNVEGQETAEPAAKAQAQVIYVNPTNSRNIEWFFSF